MSVSLRNVSGVALLVNGKQVDPDELVKVDGDLDRKGSPSDGHLIGDRIYPSALWSTEAAPKKENA